MNAKTLIEIRMDENDFMKIINLSKARLTSTETEWLENIFECSLEEASDESAMLLYEIVKDFFDYSPELRHCKTAPRSPDSIRFPLSVYVLPEQDTMAIRQARDAAVTLFNKHDLNCDMSTVTAVSKYICARYEFCTYGRNILQACKQHVCVHNSLISAGEEAMRKSSSTGQDYDICYVTMAPLDDATRDYKSELSCSCDCILTDWLESKEYAVLTVEPVLRLNRMDDTPLSQIE